MYICDVLQGAKIIDFEAQFMQCRQTLDQYFPCETAISFMDYGLSLAFHETNQNVWLLF